MNNPVTQTEIPSSEALKRIESAIGKRVHPATLYRWVNAGKVTGRRRMGRIFINQESLDRWLTGTPIQPATTDSHPASTNRGEAAAARLHSN
jgi:hypothetical protein